MATINPLNQFKALFAEPELYRAQVVQVDSQLKRVKIRRGQHEQWVSGEADLDRYVLVKDNQVTTLLPDLPFARVEV